MRVEAGSWNVAFFYCLLLSGVMLGETAGLVQYSTLMLLVDIKKTKNTRGNLHERCGSAQFNLVCKL